MFRWKDNIKIEKKKKKNTKKNNEEKNRGLKGGGGGVNTMKIYVEAQQQITDC